jgi:hypothetical protein
MTELIELQYFDNDQFELPEELEDSVYAPNQDEFKRTLLNVKASMRAITLSMPPRSAQLVKAYHISQSFKKVAEMYRVAPQTVSKHVKSPKGIQLLSLLTMCNQLVSGASSIERQQLLWRVALNNELVDPRVSISAIGEINRMTLDTPQQIAKEQQNTDLQNSPTVIIQLQDARLTPSKLDELPNHMKTIKDVN